MRSRKIILILHLAGRYPLAGIAWQAMHHVAGLARMGHDVYYVEDSGAAPYDPRIKSVVGDCQYSVGFLKRAMESFGLAGRWAYFDLAGNVSYGLSRAKLAQLYRDAEVLMNICGATKLREEHLRCPVRIYVETDPVYEQIKLAQGDMESRRELASYTHHFTYGENIGSPDCPIPAGPFHWKPTRPPVLLNLWEYRYDRDAPYFTTVTTWKNVGKDITLNGVRYYWSKHLNFRRFEDLPRRTAQKFELALEAADPKIDETLRRKGWCLVDPFEKSADMKSYQDYIYQSRGEFSVAKDLVVRTKSGWFSDRSVCYLAAGKPVITQETGFSKFIPTGRGLFAFETVEEIVSSVEEINSDYARHCKAAREIAAEYFDARKILGDMLGRAAVQAPTSRVTSPLWQDGGV